MTRLKKRTMVEARIRLPNHFSNTVYSSSQLTGAQETHLGSKRHTFLNEDSQCCRKPILLEVQREIWSDSEVK